MPDSMQWYARYAVASSEHTASSPIPQGFHHCDLLLNVIGRSISFAEV
jgi:hypothetical protein